MRSVIAAVGLAAVLGCGDDAAMPDAALPDAAPEPAFPASYPDSYVEVRNCRKSGDHDLNFIRVLADGAAAGPYMDRATPFPDGAIVLKEEYDIADVDCSGEITQWTVMVKNGAATERGGWDWQRVGVERTLVEVNSSRCYGCHTACTGIPDAVGYDYTCAEPP